MKCRMILILFYACLFSISFVQGAALHPQQPSVTIIRSPSILKRRNKRVLQGQQANANKNKNECDPKKDKDCECDPKKDKNCPEPSPVESQSPTYFVTSMPSSSPTATSSQLPSDSPSVEPTPFPTNLPTIKVSVRPSSLPTDDFSAVPTFITSSLEPSSHNPSVLLSATPSVTRSAMPSEPPSNIPSQATTTEIPSSNPSEMPTTEVPSQIPTVSSAPSKSALPSSHPSWSPTSLPTLSLAPSSFHKPSSMPSTEGSLPSFSIQSMSPFTMDLLFDSSSTDVDIDELLTMTNSYLFGHFWERLLPEYSLETMTLAVTTASVVTQEKGRRRRMLQEGLDDSAVIVAMSVLFDGETTYSSNVIPSVSLLDNLTTETFSGVSNTEFLLYLRSSANDPVLASVNEVKVKVGNRNDDSNDESSNSISKVTIGALSGAAALFIIGGGIAILRRKRKYPVETTGNGSIKHFISVDEDQISKGDDGNNLEGANVDYRGISDSASLYSTSNISYTYSLNAELQKQQKLQAAAVGNATPSSYLNNTTLSSHDLMTSSQPKNVQIDHGNLKFENVWNSPSVGDDHSSLPFDFESNHSFDTREQTNSDVNKSSSFNSSSLLTSPEQQIRKDFSREEDEDLLLPLSQDISRQVSDISNLTDALNYVSHNSIPQFYPNETMRGEEDASQPSI